MAWGKQQREGGREEGVWCGVSNRGREGGRGVAWGKQQREGEREEGVWCGVSSRGREGGRKGCGVG